MSRESSAATTGRDDVVRVPAARLRTVAETVADRAGLSAEHAVLFADALVEADLRGIFTHGTFRLPAYARGIAAGELNPAPELREVHGRGACRVIDADNGLGLVVGQLAMQRAVQLAQDHGIGAVAVRRSNHAGMLAIHVRHALAAGMIGYFTANAPGLMAPHGGREPLLSNAPFAYGIPARGEPLIADMACSYVARGTIRLAAQRGDQIPEGWALDGDGRSTRDAAAAMEGVILPMAGHKGYALAVVNEVLAASLAGAVLSMNMSRQFLRPDSTHYDSWGAGHLAIAIDPDAFASRDAFDESVEALTAALTSSEPAAGVDGVLLPGRPEEARRAAAVEDGIPLAPAVVMALREYTDAAGLPPVTE